MKMFNSNNNKSQRQLTNVPIFCFLPILPRTPLKPPPAAGRFVPLGESTKQTQKMTNVTVVKDIWEQNDSTVEPVVKD